MIGKLRLQLIVSANREMELYLKFSYVSRFADVFKPALKSNIIDVFPVSLIRPSSQTRKYLSETRALRNYVDYIKIRKCDLPMAQPAEFNSSNSIY